MGAVTVLVVFALLASIVAIMFFQVQRASWPIARGRIEATWPMGPGFIEGFADKMSLDAWLPSPESLTVNAVCPQTQQDAAEYGGLRTAMESYDLLPGGKEEPRVAIGPTAQQCYQVDWARGLERAGSYAQRTNNYKHGYPDSCSAPNHDLILDFYKEKPMEGPYQL
jgi:hypothetical protein